ncbi:sensor histidine kinase [Aliidiomarina sp.]|uniref:sensor histidine kinase n=1 Tax=Aliidiomarina sp. TaxID=1872439 RepID=UPI003A4D37C7
MSRTRGWSLTNRLNMIVTSIVALAMLLFLALSTLLVSDSERKSLLLQHEALAQQLAMRASSEGLNEQSAAAILNGLTAYPLLHHMHLYRYTDVTLSTAAIYNAPGRAAVQSQLSNFSDTTNYRFSLDYLEITQPVYRSNEIVGYVYLRASLEQVKAAHRRHLLISFAALFLVLVSASLGVRFFSKSLDSSLHRFSRIIAKSGQDSNYDIDHERDIPDEFIDIKLQVQRLLERYRHERRYAEHSADKAQKANEQLNSEVRARTQHLSEVNEKLTVALNELHRYQRKRLEQDKMASFGDVVAGIAHELNTPLGTSITAASLLHNKHEELSTQFHNDRLSKVQLSRYVQDTEKQLELMLRNLNRCSDLIRHFQQLSLLNRTDVAKKVMLCNFLEGFYLSITEERGLPEHASLSMNCNQEDAIVELRTVVLEQVLNELIDNSLIHGSIKNSRLQYEPINLSINVDLAEEFVEITYADNGHGITPEMRSKIFQPFVTSNRAKGDTGLGLFQVFNWVTQLLQGEIECESTPYIQGDESTKHGTTFLIRIPRSLQ